ncbi:hypothetical protein Ahia01_000493600, partial [Argonauta hians]
MAGNPGRSLGRRRGKNRFWVEDRKSVNDTDGWGKHGGYMNAKKTKLNQQFQSTALTELQKCEKSSNIFQGVTIYIDGYTKPSSDELKRLMMVHGGQWEMYLRKRSVTHIITTNLAHSKISALRNCKVVHPDWILKSIEAERLLPCQPFLLYTDQSGSQRGIEQFSTRQLPDPRQRHHHWPPGLPSDTITEVNGPRPPSGTITEVSCSRPPSGTISEVSCSRPPSGTISEVSCSRPPSGTIAEVSCSRPPSGTISEVSCSRPPSGTISEVSGPRPPSGTISEVSCSRPPSGTISEVSGPRPPSDSDTISVTPQNRERKGRPGDTMTLTIAQRSSNSGSGSSIGGGGGN